MIVDKLCKNCQHWNGTDPDFGVCRKASMLHGYPTNGLTKAVAVDMAYDGTRKAWSASLETAPDFGCVQFEIRND